MLFLFKAETYWLDVGTMSRLQRHLVVALRFVCYAFLAHTVYGYIANYLELTVSSVLQAVNSRCDLSDQSFSFVRNLAYNAIDASNCGALSSTSDIYPIGSNQIVTDLAGRNELQLLYAFDIEDAIVWLGVVLTIAFVLLLQEREISSGSLIKVSNFVTVGLYGVLVCNALLWPWKGHWVYGWDELLWIGGFAAIETNLSDWRKDLQDEAAGA